MIRHLGHSAARSQALQERREIAQETTEGLGRLAGVCGLCGRTHAWPEARITCLGCGELRCAGGCRCEGGEG